MTLVFLFILGATIGSFLGVLIDRLPNNQSILGWSQCDHCQHRLSWWDLLPIVSFIFLGAKCRYCQKKISFFYPLIELITGVSFLGFMIYDLRFMNHESLFINQLLLLIIISCLIVVFFSDLKYQIIPDSVQFLLFIGVLVIKLLDKSPIVPGLISGLIVMLPILFLFLITRGGGMGFGDVKLAAIIGFLLGTISGLISLYLAFILGAIVGLILIIFKIKGLKSKIAFGPFMVLGMLTMSFFGDNILELIKRIYGL